jgi:hypothetical protein
MEDVVTSILYRLLLGDIMVLLPFATVSGVQCTDQFCFPAFSFTEVYSNPSVFPPGSIASHTERESVRFNRVSGFSCSVPK